MLRITIGILLILVSLSAGTFLVKVWVADHALINGQEALAEDPELAEQHFRSSIRQNTQAPQARYLMGNALLQQAFSSEGDAIRAQAILDEAILTIRDGAELSPKDITGVEQLIRIYRTLSTLTGGTENVLPDLYTRAFILDPVNPILLIDAGEYYLTLDRTLPREEGDTSRPWANIAFEAFAHAQSLKTDLADAQLGIALTYEQLGDTENASAEFIALALAFSDDPGAHFELGDWYFRQGNHESAEQSFLTVIDIESGHANAHFRLSQIYEQQGTNDKAIAELEEVLKTNPGNEEVLAKIETLRTE